MLIPEPRNEGDERHPLRQISQIKQVENQWDDYGLAVAFLLDCGHLTVLTGTRALNVMAVHCAPCFIEAASLN